jgi:hypothetical protein
VSGEVDRHGEEGWQETGRESIRRSSWFPGAVGPPLNWNDGDLATGRATRAG